MKFKELLLFITPHRTVLLGIIGLLLVSSAFALLNPWIAGQFTGVLLGSDALYFSNINTILIAWFVIILLKSLLSFSSSYLIGSTGETITATLRTRVYNHLQTLPLSYHYHQTRGDTLALLSNDVSVISRFVTHTLVNLLPLFITLMGAFVMMLLIEPFIALLAAGLLPLYFISMKLIGRRIRPLTQAWIKAYSQMFSLVEENMGLLPAIKSFTREPLESARFDRNNAQLLEAIKQRLFSQSLLPAAISFLAGLGLLLLLWIASEQLISGHLAVSDMVSLLLYAVLLTRPVSGLADVYGQVQQTRGAAGRILALLSEQIEHLNKGEAFASNIKGRIQFQSVSFAYAGRDEVLSELNLNIKAGQTIAIVGENGAGKSTLAHLLMRMIEADSGKILIDEINIHAVSLSSLRANIGLVSQHTLLQRGTVRDNIAYGKASAINSDIIKAAKIAHAHDFIVKLPQGYDTLIGDQGLRLSGGQRQRVSLARTILKDPPILILDEATSMLDAKGASDFISECHELFKQRTTILITHQHASLALADKIVELKDGKITDTST